MTTFSRLLLASMILVTAIYEFAPVRDAGLIYQDYRWQSAFEEPGTPLPQILQTRALTRLTWWAQDHWAFAPRTFHAENLLLHVVVSVLVAFLTLSLGLSEPASWIAGAFFLLNPAQMEVAAYSAGREESIAAIGVLIACVASRQRRSFDRDISFWSTLVCIAGVVFAFGGKESAVVVFAFFPILRRDWFGTWLLLLCMIGLTACVAARWGMTPPNFSWALVQATAAWRNILSTTLLLDSAVDVDYSWVPIGVQILAFVGVAGLLASAVLLRRHFVMSIGLLIVFTVIVPRLLVYTPSSYFNDHQFYLARVGFALIAADLFTWWATPQTVRTV